MRDEGQKELHTSIPYEKSRARRMARKLGLRVIRSAGKGGPVVAAAVARGDEKQGGQEEQTRTAWILRKKMMEQMAS